MDCNEVQLGATRHVSPPFSPTETRLSFPRLPLRSLRGRGPQFAERTSLAGHPTCGGLGKPLGWGEVWGTSGIFFRASRGMSSLTGPDWPGQTLFRLVSPDS